MRKLLEDRAGITSLLEATWRSSIVNDCRVRGNLRRLPRRYTLRNNNMIREENHHVSKPTGRAVLCLNTDFDVL